MLNSNVSRTPASNSIFPPGGSSSSSEVTRSVNEGEMYPIHGGAAIKQCTTYMLASKIHTGYKKKFLTILQKVNCSNTYADEHASEPMERFHMILRHHLSNQLEPDLKVWLCI